MQFISEEVEFSILPYQLTLLLLPVLCVYEKEQLQHLLSSQHIFSTALTHICTIYMVFLFSSPLYLRLLPILQYKHAVLI